ncbi:MAG: type II toxin-antitoxin system VapC family toxin [Alphaproteobacteria bacterium]|nr:type II toxin-antitoxin system VapC family toxin [Alphaproteobacteria bacterium]
MRLLLDTHAFLWWLEGNPALSRTARTAMGESDNTVFVSAVTAWEIATKIRLGRLPLAELLADDISGYLDAQGFVEMPVRIIHGQRAGALPDLHRDPFDRMLIAQSLIEGCSLVSNERLFDRYGVERFW